MSVNQTTFDEMSRWRQVYFQTSVGREVLTDLLRGLGLLVPWSQLEKNLCDPDATRGVRVALEILAQLGVWHRDNFDRLIQKMAELPMPELEND